MTSLKGFCQTRILAMTNTRLLAMDPGPHYCCDQCRLYFCAKIFHPKNFTVTTNFNIMSYPDPFMHTIRHDQYAGACF